MKQNRTERAMRAVNGAQAVAERAEAATTKAVAKAEGIQKEIATLAEGHEKFETEIRQTFEAGCKALDERIDALTAPLIEEGKRIAAEIEKVKEAGKTARDEFKAASEAVFTQMKEVTDKLVAAKTEAQSMTSVCEESVKQVHSARGVLKDAVLRLNEVMGLNSGTTPPVEPLAPIPVVPEGNGSQT